MCELQIKSILRIAPYILSIVLILLRLSSVRFSFSSTSTLNISRVLQTPFVCPWVGWERNYPFYYFFCIVWIITWPAVWLESSFGNLLLKMDEKFIIRHNWLWSVIHQVLKEQHSKSTVLPVKCRESTVRYQRNWLVFNNVKTYLSKQKEAYNESY